MFPVPIVSSCEEISLEKFWNTVLLYHDRPHLVNRRLAGALTVLFLKVDFLNENVKRLSEMFTRSAILYQLRKLKDFSQESITKDLVRNILDTYDKEVDVEDSSVQDFMKSTEDVYVTVKILLPRHHLFESCVEIAVLDKKNMVATFFAVSEFDKKILAPNFPYDIELTPEGNLRICVQDFETADTVSAEWLSSPLFDKLMKWAENQEFSSKVPSSLALVSIDKYVHLYHNLKIKYGEKIVKNWTERTDPLKFVYEDIAIATYLICLWEETNAGNKPSFVDLGCGNGLLVYILNEEGFPGYGIDVRKRNIWEWYPKTTVLKVEAITPSASSLYPESDWIIGNHSDELTPWIPVIAARSSHKTNFFLLPCCSYEFSGRKYKRKNSSISTYTEYLDYVQDICKTCQFNVQIDKLRIPSTKRTCIVSYGRSYKPEAFPEVNKQITNLITQHCVDEDNINKSEWVDNFQPRSDIERVRNCTQLDKKFITNIVNKVSRCLLLKNNLQEKADGTKWNRGGTLLLPELIPLIEPAELKELKNQCGGMQTLLKNHSYIFKVEKGCVKLKVPSTVKAVGRKYKDKSCWFHKNHPQGCCNDDESCAYSHVN